MTCSVKTLLAIAVSFCACPTFAAAPPASDEHDAPLHIAVHPVLPLNEGDPEIIIRYCNARSDTPILLHLPKGDAEIEAFRELFVVVDGIKAEHVTDKYERYGIWPKRSTIVDLKYKHCVELRMKLSTVFRLPKTWRKLKVTAPRLGGIQAEVLGTLLLQRSAHDAPAVPRR